MTEQDISGQQVVPFQQSRRHFQSRIRLKIAEGYENLTRTNLEGQNPIALDLSSKATSEPSVDHFNLKGRGAGSMVFLSSCFGNVV